VSADGAEGAVDVAGMAVIQRGIGSRSEGIRVSNGGNPL